MCQNNWYFRLKFSNYQYCNSLSLTFLLIVIISVHLIVFLLKINFDISLRFNVPEFLHDLIFLIFLWEKGYYLLVLCSLHIFMTVLFNVSILKCDNKSWKRKSRQKIEMLFGRLLHVEMQFLSCRKESKLLEMKCSKWYNTVVT